MKNHTAPWSDEEIALLGTMTDRALAEQLGRTHAAVERKRMSLGVTSHTEHKRSWTRSEVAKLGKVSDRELAHILGIARGTVLMERRRRGIAPFRADCRPHHLD